MTKIIEPYEYLYQSVSFYNAAYSEFQRRGIENEVVYSLVFHSLELILKGYLLYKGFKDKQLRKISHDLFLAFEESNKHSLQDLINLSGKEVEDLTLLSKYSVGKKLYYPSDDAFRKYPEAEDIILLNKKMVLALEPILESTFSDEIKERFKKHLSDCNLTKEEYYFNAEHGIYRVIPYDKEEIMNRPHNKKV